MFALMELAVIERLLQVVGYNEGDGILAAGESASDRTNIFVSKGVYTALLSVIVLSADCDMRSKSALQSVAQSVKALPLGQW